MPTETLPWCESIIKSSIRLTDKEIDAVRSVTLKRIKAVNEAGHRDCGWKAGN